MAKKLYRAEAYSTENAHHICYYEYHVMKKTPCGCWIDNGGVRRFVLNTSRKRFAHETHKAALASLVARKRRQVKILKWQLQTAQECLALALSGEPTVSRPTHLNFE